MKRKIVKIDEEKCDGCGVCVPNCHEGALQIIDGKARLISDLFCDGLGACIGYCPQDAIEIEEREAEAYDERKVMDYIVKGGMNVIVAHLQHLDEHNETVYLKEALSYLEEKGIKLPEGRFPEKKAHHSGCPGSMARELSRQNAAEEKEENISENAPIPSRLQNWPVQMHLINPAASFFRNADLLLAADCCAYAMGDFHGRFLKGKTLAIACPKLDQGKEIYLNKLCSLIDHSEINSITVMIMEVPCCRGLLQLVQQAVNSSERKIPIKAVMVSIQGEILLEQEI